MKPEQIKELIQQQMPEAQISVQGDGAHFEAIVISPQFAGKSRVQKQKIVYDTVNAHLLDGSLHALSIKTFTPDEWQLQQGSA